jgi:8-oxo-dGTP diphosphatase
MSTLRREVASAILIDTFGRFLLQQRDNIPGIYQPGKVGLFGGHREGNETYLQCVIREVREEVGFALPPGSFEFLTSYEGSDFDVIEGGTIHAEFFVVRDVQVDSRVVTEGSLLVVRREELIDIEPKLAPSALFAIKALLHRLN